jgi:Putative HNHc nuclease
MRRSMPKRRKPIKTGIRRGPKREWLKHQKYVRGFECSVSGCPCRDIEFAHARLGAQLNGMRIKPPDWYGLPLCGAHHREQHDDGEDTFRRRYHLDMIRVALDLARQSPDMAMREEMREWHRDYDADMEAVLEDLRMAA